jgi:hypothetical protein
MVVSHDWWSRCNYSLIRFKDDVVFADTNRQGGSGYKLILESEDFVFAKLSIAYTP